MQDSKILLSQDELSLAKNKDVILTKNAVIRKVVSEFAELAGKFQKIAENYHDIFPNETFLIPPKISKGEQHEELPYVMLDYPRIFSKENVFAIRCFFWWGNFFSFTLHLKGIYKEQYENIIFENASVLSENGFHIGISEEEWRNDFAVDNYRPMNEDLAENISRNDFMKIAAKWELDENGRITMILEDKFRFILELLA